MIFVPMENVNKASAANSELRHTLLFPRLRELWGINNHARLPDLKHYVVLLRSLITILSALIILFDINITVNKISNGNKTRFSVFSK